MALSKIQSGLLDTNSVDATALSSSAIAVGDLPVGTVVQTKAYGFGGTMTGFSNSIAVDLTSGQTAEIGGGSITPTSSSNKILIVGHQVCHIDNNNGYSYLRLIRNVSATDTIIMSPGNAVGFQVAGSGFRVSIPYACLDAPATTSTISYKLRVDHQGLTVDQTWNYGSCSLVLMEIAE